MCTVFTNQQTKPPTRNLPKRNRRGGACVPARTSAQRRFHTQKYTHCARGFNDECALGGRHVRVAAFPYPKRFVYHASCAGNLTTDAPLQGDTGGHIGTAPTKLHHIFPRIPHKQNNHLRVINPNETNHSTRNQLKRHQPPTRNPPKRSRRGGACVPARTFTQRRFHTKNTRIVYGE